MCACEQACMCVCAHSSLYFGRCLTVECFRVLQTISSSEGLSEYSDIVEVCFSLWFQS